MLTSHCKCAILLPSGFTPALSILMKKTLITIAALAAASLAANAELIGQWEFEENLNGTMPSSVGATAKDTAGYTTSVAQGTVLTENREGAWRVEDNMGSALTLSGTNRVILTGYNETFARSIDMSKSFTIGAYVNFSENFSDIATIFGTGSGTGSGLAVAITGNDTNGYKFDLLKKSVVHVETNVISDLNANEWNHVALSYSYDATTQTGTATWLLNGWEVATQTFSSTGDSNYNNLYWNKPGYEGATIGGTSVDAVTGFDGTLQLDRVQVFNTALTAYEVRQAAGIIPEPTTATLSLLALAGLAARRRRK